MRTGVQAALLGLALSGVSVAQNDTAPGPDPTEPGGDERATAERSSAGPQQRPRPNGAISNPEGSQTSPVRGIERRLRRRGAVDTAFQDQSIDGSNNNLDAALMGSTHSRLVRVVSAAYDDGVSTLAGANLASARAISNVVHAQAESIPNSRGLSDFLWQWGQFLDHDIDLTDGVDPAKPAPIEVPRGDEFFDPESTSDQLIGLNRSIYDQDTGTGVDNPRQQLNEITSWIDASNVYGSDDERAATLRTRQGGLLKTSEGNLLPFNLARLANAGGSGSNLFLAGDVRANEQVGLTVMHTLFVREHNRIAQRVAEHSPRLDDEKIYQRARREVVALMQIITYREFLPALLGQGAIAAYNGYDASVDGGIRNVFSAAAYRLGHTMLSPTLLRLEADGTESSFGHLSLADAFFRPSRLTEEGGIDSLLRGLAAQACQSVDVFVIDEVRNFLFGLPGSGGFDLASLNIQRGRDHGLGSYNAARQAYGLPAVGRFDQVSSKPLVVQRLADAYQSAGEMDVWTAGLAEDPVGDGLLGPLFRAILIDQFQALRDGDRFWYEGMFDEPILRRLERTRLSDVIRRNTNIGDEIPDNVFFVAP